MPRRTQDVLITTAGRDKGKVFRLTEMPCSQAEKWAGKAFLALIRSGVTVPDDIASAGLAGIAQMGLTAFTGVSFEELEPLLDEMFGCIGYVVDPTAPIYARPLIEDDIEEIATRLRLRIDVFNLHVDFSTVVAPWISAPATANGAGLPAT